MTDANIKAQIDERRVARGIAIGLPIATLACALAIGSLLGFAMGILVTAAGVLLGVIALFWASLRVLSGDAALPPEIEALDRTAHGVDALASRKKMLVVALKDLENEHALGKLDDEDFEQVSSTYRAELKDVMKRIDATLEPYRGRATELAQSHLARSGLADDEVQVGPAKVKLEAIAESLMTGNPVIEGKIGEEKVAIVTGDVRVACPKCETSNEEDAKFCKKCGATLSAAGAR